MKGASRIYSLQWPSYQVVGSLQVQHWLNQLCEELSERLLSDLDQNKRIAHTLMMHGTAYKVPICFVFEPSLFYPIKFSPTSGDTLKFCVRFLSILLCPDHDYPSGQ